MSRASVSYEQFSEQNESFHEANETPHRAHGGGAIQEEEKGDATHDYGMKSAAK